LILIVFVWTLSASELKKPSGSGTASDVSCTTCIDISGETNLAVTAPIVLTGDTVSVTQNAGTNIANDLEEEGVTCTGCVDATDLANAAVSAVHSFSIETPGAAENIIAFVTDVAITVVSVSSVCLGTTPSVTWNFAHGTDITSTADVFSADPTTTSVTTLEVDNSSFTDATIAASEAVLFQSSAASGTILVCNFTMFYTVD